MAQTYGPVAVATRPRSYVMDDVRRAREFYRYLQPDNLILPQLRRRDSTFDSNITHVPSLSSSLAPYCQLAVLRCNATKAMLNVMDREIMYFLAESYRTRTDDDKENIFEFVEDPILQSCSAMPLKGRICELTIRQDNPEEPDRIPSFVIPDLLDSQFAAMTIVTGPPYYRFYAGVPITTRDGVNIGSIAIMDNKPRPHGLTRSEEQFLAATADQVMQYLETNRQAIEGRSSRRMAEGLEAFISGKSSVHDVQTNGRVGPSTKKSRAAYGLERYSEDEEIAPHEKSPTHKRLPHLRRRKDSVDSIDSDFSTSGLSTETEEQKDEVNIGNNSRSHAQTFARAANLLRECMGNLGEDGSVRFVSLKAKSGGVSGNVQPSQKSNDPIRSNGTATKTHSNSSPTNDKAASPIAIVMASSTEKNPFGGDQDPITGSAELDDVALRDLMRRYPSGHLWSLEETAYSSEEDTAEFTLRRTSTHTTAKRSRKKRSEIQAIQATFPGARQVLFTPLWDATIGAFAHGVFVTTSLETRSFSATSELSFLNSFCSTLMAECNRLDTMMADKQKSDFVGTISHEMRSPLHGVLASVEFLAETEMSSFQRTLIDTIDSCGRTLLDTINHVLDFSKVNSFQKQWEASNKRGIQGSRRNPYIGSENAAKAIAQSAPPLLQLFGVTNVSAVLEEVVDGLVLGHTYTSGVDFADLSGEARGRSNRKAEMKTPRLTADPVEITLDIEQADWTFMTQPGAVRRIIMNITGNAIKYTTVGSISVCLRLKEVREGSETTEYVVLTVTDTGKGISPEFLSSRLFVPFAQENALAPGTGLGLSIVRSIVLMLGGTIDVQSTVAKGTTVEVSLPVKRPLPGQISTQGTPHTGETAGSGSSLADDSILLLQNQAAGATVVYYGARPTPTDRRHKIVEQYVRDWYHLDFVDQVLVESASVVIVDGEDLDRLIEEVVGTPGHRPALVVLCPASSRHSASFVQSLEQRLGSPVEFLAKPCGPYKLARSICLALTKKYAINPRFPSVTNLGVIEEALTPYASVSSGPTSVATDMKGEELRDLDLNAPGSDDTAKIVQATETFAASQSSHNAQKAIHSSGTGPNQNVASPGEAEAFPFPSQETKSEQHPEESIQPTISVTVAVSPGQPPPATQSQPIVASGKVNPNLLLVDDNKINLNLLETFLTRKRKYTRIKKAEDGQQALDAVTTSTVQYDIIFMDISMPIMNGFEATRAIREFEEKNNVKAGAMVIALTGLASGQDQSEGFDSGCDIYMTKPVSFKEVGKLLDNWESHQELNTATESMAQCDLQVLGPSSEMPAINGHQVTS